MVQISEVKGNSRENRTAAHTHIKGLGLRNDGYAETTGAGFVGQVAAREVHGFLHWVTANRLISMFSTSGMRCRGGPDQVEEDVRTSRLVSRWTRHRQDGAGIGGITRAGNESSLLSHRRQRSLFYRSQEDGGADGELPKSHR